MDRILVQQTSNLPTLATPSVCDFWVEEYDQSIFLTTSESAATAPHDLKPYFIKARERHPVGTTFVETVPNWVRLLDAKHRIKTICHLIKAAETMTWTDVFPNYEPFVPKGYLRNFKRLKEFSNLKDDWDTYGGKPISMDVISKAASLLLKVSELKEQNQLEIAEPFIAPRSDDGIQYEWENDSKYLELSALSESEKYRYFATDESVDPPVESSGDLSFSYELLGLFSWLIKGDAAALTRWVQRLKLDTSDADVQ